MASVTELEGKFSAPETYRLVVEALVIKSLITTEEVVNKLVLVILTAPKLEIVVLAKIVLVVMVIAPLENCINGVPVTDVPFK